MSANDSNKSSKRSYALMALKFAVSAVLLGILFSQVDVVRLWATARRASVPWLLLALAVYFVTILASTWRWRLLLNAQDVHVHAKSLLQSYLVAQFFNNFLPSNIGGDVIRIRDTAKPAGSKTLATTVVLVDRGLGLMGLVLVAALSATISARNRGPAMPIWPAWLWTGFLAALAASVPAVLTPAGFGRLLRPLTVFHPEWVGERIEKLTGTLSRFRARPTALIGCFGGAIFVQLSIVAFYFTVTYALHVDIRFSDLAVVVPVSFIVQMLPVSVNGFGVREATFAFYFTRVGHAPESALLIPLAATAMVMLFSLSGAAVWFARGHH
jgi:glycosyltransferase 2 family protein